MALTRCWPRRAQWPRLLRTTAFRLSVAYAVLYGCAAFCGFGYVYWTTVSFIQMQIDKRLELETQVLLNRYQNQALPALVETLRQRDQNGHRPQLFFYLLFSPLQNTDDMTALDQSRFDMISQRPVGFASLTLSEVLSHVPSGLQTDTPVRVLISHMGGGYRLLVGRDLNDETRLLQHTLVTVVIVSGVIFLITLLGSLWLGHRALHRIDLINRTAGDIMAGNFSQRLPVTHKNNEFDELSLKLNAMLAQIEKLLLGMRQVTDNVAHDLRKPLTRLRNRLEVALMEQGNSDVCNQAISQAIDDADDLLRTFNALLSIAQAEAGVKRQDWKSLDLSELIADVAEMYEAVAEDHELVWQAHWDEDLVIEGQQQLLAQAFSNLLDNAMKYTPTGGQIGLYLKKMGDWAVVTVTDSGPGIPTTDCERVLERFVRLDSARSLPGNGLGLSLVKAVAQLHSATLALDDNLPGLKVTLAFPLKPSATKKSVKKA